MHQLEQLLFSMKGNITQQGISKIKSTAKQLGVEQLKLWKIKPQVKALFKMAKYQSYVLLFAGIFILPMTLYQKYKDDNDKLPGLVAITPFALAICFSPIYFYRKYTKTLLNQISYNLKTNCFQMAKYNSSKNWVKDIRPCELQLQENKKGRIRKMTNTKLNEVSQIQGIGQWSNLDLFKQILRKQVL